MPAPIPVELLPHTLHWAVMANNETEKLREQLGDEVIAVHHIGSTSIAGICAKPIIDLLPVVRSVERLDGCEAAFQSLGYRYWGEYGIAGRRYCEREDAATGKRLFQLHCFEPQSFQVERHLAFRDFLRSNAKWAAAYEADKQRCQSLHPNDSHAYSDAKSAWISEHLPAAIDWFRVQRQDEHPL